MLRIGWWGVPLACWPLLSGCGVPTAVTVASLAADGVSYATTGKSVTDHGLSAATGEDCALLRVVERQAICRNNAERDSGAPAQIGKGAAPAAPEGAAARGRYVALGSFLDSGNAARAMARYAILKPKIILVEVGGRQFHRVVVGPLSPAAAAALKARLAAGQDLSRRAG